MSTTIVSKIIGLTPDKLQVVVKRWPSRHAPECDMMTLQVGNLLILSIEFVSPLLADATFEFIEAQGRKYTEIGYGG